MPNRMSARARYTAAAFAVTGGLGLAAFGCGDDDTTSADSSSADTTSTEASAEEVTLTATEYEFDLSATPTADTKTVTATNDGKEFHVMIFAKINEGFTLDEVIKLEGEKGSAEVVAQTEAGPGETKTAEVKGPLEAGEYAMLCPVGGPQGPHYKLGQLEEFSIQ
jgi:hypothetical protein